jgi:hypothetical protein
MCACRCTDLIGCAAIDVTKNHTDRSPNKTKSISYYMAVQYIVTLSRFFDSEQKQIEKIYRYQI